MTKEEEIPDWVGAQEFYDKYEPKEILGRYVCLLGEAAARVWPGTMNKVRSRKIHSVLWWYSFICILLQKVEMSS